MRKPAMNLILSSVKNDFDFTDPLPFFELFLEASSFSLVITDLCFSFGSPKVIILNLTQKRDE
jgi:hypothetical protein